MTPLHHYNNLIADYDDLTYCLTSVRAQHIAIVRRDEVEEQRASFLQRLRQKLFS